MSDPFMEDNLTNSQWTPEAISALGATTDLPTLGSIFGVSTWRSRQMSHTGEWEQLGIRILKIGQRYRVAVPSILEVLKSEGASDAGKVGRHRAPTSGDGMPAEPSAHKEDQ